ncbi:EF-hand domain-containing protein [Mangrovimicrobium sediminis]|uniref:EF-hand domain-containing protein n=1 Tax=Mangrovimicrobium sediminis TaxID=2562682 RepID=A0A4Z0LUK1_9GAMM|nr:EF-hand domain-containing protein [Haliea sp. SAOS-164]TGD70939.1 EF-hand domain-containing protein [Haliea sp. SAOS-164]
MNARRTLANGVLFACTGALLGACTTATTPETGDTPEHSAAAQFVSPFFVELDCEHVGYIQTGEADEHIGPIFRRFDIDGSRNISRQEWLAYRWMENKQWMALSFDTADSDDDALVSVAEFRTYLIWAIGSLDSDSDGEVHPEDLQRYLPQPGA